MCVGFMSLDDGSQDSTCCGIGNSYTCLLTVSLGYLSAFRWSWECGWCANFLIGKNVSRMKVSRLERWEESDDL